MYKRPANDLVGEVTNILSKVNDRDEVMPEIKVMAKIYSGQILSLQKQYKNSRDLLDPILHSLEKQENISADIEIELVNYHIFNKQLDRANLKSQELVKKYSDNESVLEKIDCLMYEPVSKRGKKTLQKENKKGINFYKEKNNLSAIDCFSKLEKKYPSFTTVKLNLVQALLGHIKDVGKDQTCIERCTSILTLLKSQIKNNDTNFERCQKLQGMLSAFIVKKGENNV